MPITKMGHMNDIIQMCRGNEARNSYGIVEEFKLTSSTS